MSIRAVLCALAVGCGPSPTPVADGGPDGGGPACETAPAVAVAGCDSIVGESHPCEGQGHVEPGTERPWASNPPQSGDHYGQWETCDAHDEAVARGNWIHNLEHGAVVLLYRCEPNCDTELGLLREVMDQRPEERILLTPDPLLDGPRFAAVAWTWTYETDAPELETFLCFVDQHEGQAPEDVGCAGD